MRISETLLWIFFLSIIWLVPGRAQTIVYDETINGQLSTDINNPTAITVIDGLNEIRVETGTTNGVNQYFSITVPIDRQISNFQFSSFPDIGGNTIEFTLTDIVSNTDIIMFPALGSGIVGINFIESLFPLPPSSYRIALVETDIGSQPLVIHIGITQCSPGQFKDSGSCTDCPAGRFTNSFDATSCNLCEIGKYQDTPGSQSCVSCPPGTTTLATGSTSMTQCVPIQQVPTLSQWGIIALLLMMLIFSLVTIKKTKEFRSV
jgi:hypothetical protein